ncbi:MAG: hypothetical protein Q7K35_04730 [bacterium]|nr:hypothetical protein [bacterium]
MNMNKFISLIKIKKQTIASVVILFLTITAIITFSQPLKYNSESSVLVVQNFPSGTDQYSISKSNEYISNILAKVVSSNLFYVDVLNAGFNIDKNYFSKTNNVNTEMDKWKKAVQAKAIGDTGIIDINIYHPNKQQLNQIAMAVNFILQSKHGKYHGLGSNIVIKIIDQPIISTWPAKPNIILNLLLAIAVGLIVSFYYIYLFQEESFNLRLWPKLNGRRMKKERILNNQIADSINELADLSQLDKNEGNNLDLSNGKLDFRAEPVNQVTAEPKIESEPSGQNYEAEEKAGSQINEGINQAKAESQDQILNRQGSMKNVSGN